MSKSSCVKFLVFVAWNIQTVIFSSFFCFLGIAVVQLIFMLFWPLSLIFLCPFFMKSSSCRIDASALLSMMARTFLPYYLGTFRQCHRSDIRPCASSSAFLSTGPFVEVLPSSISRMVPSTLQAGDNPGVYYFEEIPAAEIYFEKGSRSLFLMIYQPSWYL